MTSIAICDDIYQDAELLKNVTDKEFVLNTLFENYIKIAKVNLYTGEYQFVKCLNTPMEAKCLEAPTMDEYTRLMVKYELIHPRDKEEYSKHLDITYLRERVQGVSREISYSFRRRINNIYEWVTFEAVAPKEFSRENPWVIMTWKYSDTSVCVMQDSLRMLSIIYYKILKVNLTQDSYEIIKAMAEEGISMDQLPGQISVWFRLFEECGNVFPDDMEEYNAFTNIQSLRMRFHSSRECIRLRYRRKIAGDFRWVTMEMLPGIEYTDADQVIMLYIKDIHDDYIAEIRHHKELEYYCNYDVLTGIWNRYYYDNVCRFYMQSDKRFSVGTVFADLNRLKYINDHFGHEVGDDYIRRFSKQLSETFGQNNCFRISGDEFIVLLTEISQSKFEAMAMEFYACLQAEEQTLASIGFCWQEAAETLEAVVNNAEAAMYDDKRRFYEKNPQFRR